MYVDLGVLHHRPLPKVEAKKAKNAENRQQDTEALWLQQALNRGKKNASALVSTIREHLLVGLYQTCTSTHLFDTLITGMGRGKAVDSDLNTMWALHWNWTIFE